VISVKFNLTHSTWNNKITKRKKNKKKTCCQLDIYTRADFLITNFIIVDRDRARERHKEEVKNNNNNNQKEIMKLKELV
jgi:hypothetical protein